MGSFFYMVLTVQRSFLGWRGISGRTRQGCSAAFDAGARFKQAEAALRQWRNAR